MKKKRKPTPRQMLAVFTDRLDERVVSAAELAQWEARLEAEPSYRARAKILMGLFLPWLTERMHESTVRMMTQHGLRHPSQN